MASLPFLLLEQVPNFNWDTILTNLYGTARLTKNLLTRRHLLGWDESVQEKPDNGFFSNLKDDVVDLGRDGVNQITRLFET